MRVGFGIGDPVKSFQRLRMGVGQEIEKSSRTLRESRVAKVGGRAQAQEEGRRVINNVGRFEQLNLERE